MKNIPTFIDLFSGCGGLSLGFLKSGWKGIFAIEHSKEAFLTYKINLVESGRFNYEWPEFLSKKEHNIEDLITNYANDLKKLENKIDLIIGGPPCQGFSHAGKRNPNDPRNKMTEQYIKIVNIIKPKFLVIENVKGYNTTFRKNPDDIPYSKIVQQKLEETGYITKFNILKCAEWGVPQIRPRFILIATRKDLNFNWDPFNDLNKHRISFLIKRNLDPNQYQTVLQAIGDLETKGKKLIYCNDSSIKNYQQIKYEQPNKLSKFQALMRMDVSCNQEPNSLRLPKHRPYIIERFKKILNECPKGKCLTQELFEKYGMKKHSLIPLCPFKPAPTLTTLPDDYLHYSEPRILTVREMARLQSFPDWFEFLGSYTTGGQQRKNSCPRYTQVGNAVPPLFSEALGELIMRAINIIN